MSRRGIVSYTLLVISFGLLSYFAHRFPYFPGDIEISHWVQQIDLPLFEPVMRAVSFIGNLVPAGIIVFLVCAGFLLKGKRLAALSIGSTTLVECLVNQPLKILIDRPRPGEELVRVMVMNGEKSFPSGHTLYGTAVYGLLFYLAPVIIRRPVALEAVRLALVALILLSALSRIYLGAHWFSDVMGGFLLGALILAPAITFYRTYRGRLAGYA